MPELDAKMEFRREFIDDFGKFGWMGVAFTSKYGGSEGDTIGYAIVKEEIARVNSALSLNLDTYYTAMEAIYKYGTEDLRQRFLPKLVTGKLLSAFTLTEREAGSDAAAVGCTAILDKDEYVINGEKSVGVGVTVSDVAIGFFKTDSSQSPGRGISAIMYGLNAPRIKKYPPTLSDCTRVAWEELFSKM